MALEENIEIAERLLIKAKAEIEAENYHIAIQTIATVYANVREALQWAYKLDYESKQASSPAGENIGGTKL